MRKKYCIAGKAIDDCMAHVHCLLDIKDFKYTCRICNTFCFSMATVVAPMHLNVMLYIHCLSCWDTCC